MKINREWHKKHPIPKKPSLDQRIAWHIDHHANCSCRDIPQKIQEEIRKRGV